METNLTASTASFSEAGSDDIERLPKVRQRTGLGRSTIYRLMAKGLFPSAVQLTPRAVGWPKAQIDAWLAERPKAAH